MRFTPESIPFVGTTFVRAGGLVPARRNLLIIAYCGLVFVLGVMLTITTAPALHAHADQIELPDGEEAIELARSADEVGQADGQSSFSAAASCWEIKQNYPSSPDGLYWLVTPTLQAPQEFYCDMTTDGGGWVLVGRGREGWKDYYQGLRPARVTSPVSGTGAFVPAQLEAWTVDGLLDGGRVDALDDGIRLRRAANAAGTSWQEARVTVDRWDGWAWTFTGERPVVSYSFDGAQGSGGQTRNFGNNQQFQRVNTGTAQQHGWVWGFAYGPQVLGTNSSTTHLYSTSNNQGNARPFTQVYLRPQLTLADLDFPEVPAEGTPDQEQSALAETDAMTTIWGVTGLANGSDGELNTEVQAFAEVDGRVYVGGNFQYVQRNANGLDRVEQPYLAAFDVETGQYIASFTPTFNNQVKTLQALPDGRLAVGGHFTQINGQDQAVLALVDPMTGELAGEQVLVENRNTGGSRQVRNLDVHGDLLYIAGGFTHLSGASAWNGGRVNWATGEADAQWNPGMNGTSVGLDASESGERTYFSGYFRMTGSTETISANALSTSTGANLIEPLWQPTMSSRGHNNNWWQFAVGEGGDRVWLAGSEHSMFSYDRDTFELMEGHITKDGGDFQYMHLDGDVMYSGCHCDHWNYQNEFTWPNLVGQATHAHKIGQLGAYDTVTGDFLPEFSPVVQGRRGYGVWASFTDSTGRLWMGGDFTSSIRVNQGASFLNQWSGGFIRFEPRDTSAPSTPGEVSLTAEGDGVRLSWEGSSDDSGEVTYEVLFDNRVVAMTASTTILMPRVEGRYFVRAVDSAGNRSASTPEVVIEPPPDNLLTFIPMSAQWSWQYDNEVWPQGWSGSSFDDSQWSVGEAPLGRGTSLVNTNIMESVVAPVPLSAQFRHVFEVEDPASVVDGVITTRADDGVVVFVNGVEVGRANMGQGSLHNNSYATVAPQTATAVANPVTFEVPSSVLVEGQNVVAVSAHANYRTSPNVSFDLSFTAARGEPVDPVELVTPQVQASALDSTSVELSWSADPEVEVVEYRISRDGEQVAVLTGSELEYLDTELDPATEYEYSVVAHGPFGTVSEPGVATVTTLEDLDLTLVPQGAQWSWQYDNEVWPQGWSGSSFDDSQWSVGEAPLGRGTSLVSTNIMPSSISPVPLSAQFRHVFEVEDPASVVDGVITTRADDGVVVFVNGVEVGRANMGQGSLHNNSYATVAPQTATAVANPVTFEVPAEVLVAGENLIAVSTHGNYRATPNLTFDLSFTATYAGSN